MSRQKISQVKLNNKFEYELTGEGVRIVNGPNYFNRPLYGTNSPGMLHAGDKPYLAFDLHYAGGKAGNVLFAVLGSKKSKWLHEAAHIEFTYIPGRCRYMIKDPLLGPGSLQIDIVPLDCGDGFIVKLDATKLKSSKELMFFYGGGSGTFLFKYGGGKKQRPRAYGEPDTFDPFLYFEPKHCKKNILQVNNNIFTLKTASGTTISADTKRRKNSLPDPSPGPKTIQGAAYPSGCWHMGDAENFNHRPQSLIHSSAANHPAALFRWNARDVSVQYIIIKAGADTDIKAVVSQAEKSFIRCCRHFDKLSRTAEIRTPDPHLDMSFRAHIVALDGAYEPPFIFHGARDWRGLYLGWRSCHGFNAIGWHDRVRSNLLTHAEGQILDDPYLKGLLPSVYKGGGASYEMSQVFLDMLLYHYEWTGDLSMMKSLLPRLQLIIEAERRLYDHDNDFLYTNKLNYFITDAHWFYDGPCPEASAYMYRAYRGLVNVLKELKKPSSAYEERVSGIRKAMNDVLWLTRKGHFAQYKDAVGLKRTHEEAELSAVYHPIEFELTDMFQSYQQLQYVETHLDSCAWGDGLIYWSSNWMPAYKDGNRSHFYTSRSLASAENFNLALAYYRIRQSDVSYKLLRGGVYACYNNLYPLAMGYTATPEAKAYHSIDFTDVTSTYIRAIVEGLFGIRPNLPEREMVLEPNFPSHWNKAFLRTLDFTLEFKKQKNKLILRIDTNRKTYKKFRLAIRSEKIGAVTINGKKTEWTVEPGIGCAVLAVRSALEHETVVSVEALGKSPSVSAPKSLRGGQRFSVKPSGSRILEWHDPQNVLLSPVIRENNLLAKAADDAPGHHTFFVLVDTGNLSCWLPVNIEIKDMSPTVVSFVKPEKNTRQKTVDLSAFYTHSLNSVFQESYVGPRALNDGWDCHRPDGLPQHVVRTIPKISLRKQVDERWTVDESGFRSKLGRKISFMTEEGIRFKVSPKETKAAFISRWDTFDSRLIIPIKRSNISKIYFLTAGTTEVMQTHIENVRVSARYADGEKTILDLVNPFNYDDSIGAFGFQHTSGVPMVSLSENAHLDVYAISVDPSRITASVEAEVLSQGIIFGIAALTLELN